MSKMSAQMEDTSWIDSLVNLFKEETKYISSLNPFVTNYESDCLCLDVLCHLHTYNCSFSFITSILYRRRSGHTNEA